MANYQAFNAIVIVTSIISSVEQINSDPIHGGFPAARTYSSGDKYLIENDGEYPYMAQLERKIPERYLCGAIIIKPQFVLSAAHCVHDKNAENLLVRAGTFLIGDKISKFVQVRNVEKFRFSQQFLKDGKFNFDYDIAVLKLKEAFDTSSQYVRIISIASEKLDGKFIGKKLKVLGFGETEKERRSIYLQSANMKVISNTQCKELGGGQLEYLICALGSDQDVGVKCGDSGGALVQHIEGQPLKDVLVGVASFKVRRCDKDFNPKLPSVFVEVAKYNGWIERIIRTM